MHYDQVLAEELGGLIGGLSFGRSMRWSGEAAFSRPVRWLLALHGAAAVPCAFAGLQAGPRSCSSAPHHVSALAAGPARRRRRPLRLRRPASRSALLLTIAP